jgi:hypothetical protein
MIKRKIKKKNMSNKSHHINSVSLKHIKTLCIDLGDTHVTVVEVGVFNNKKQYMWLSVSPTEGLEMDYLSEIIQYDSLILRLDMITDQLKDEEYHAIKLFVEEDK